MSVYVASGELTILYPGFLHARTKVTLPRELGGEENVNARGTAATLPSPNGQARLIDL